MKLSLLRHQMRCIPLKCVRFSCMQQRHAKIANKNFGRPLSLPVRLSATPEELPDISPELEKEIEESSEMIDQMVREVNKHLLIDTATAYVSGDQTISEKEIENALKITVEPRMKQLNPTFLPLLDSYILAAQENVTDQDPKNNILGILMAIKKQILDFLSLDLPEDLRVLESALSVSNADERAALLRKHITGDVQPQCDLSSLYATTSRLLDDVQGEDGNTIADHKLLAKLCIVREELRMILREQNIIPCSKKEEHSHSSDVSDANGDAAPTPEVPLLAYSKLKGIPRQEAAFLKELLAVNQPEKRRMLLETAFRGEYVENSHMKIRAGAFLDSLTAIQQEMNEKKGGHDDNEEKVLLRLEEVWRESFVALEDIAVGNSSYSP